MCTCNTYRHPAYLAKVAASIDAIRGAVSKWASGPVGTSTSTTDMGTRSAGARLACSGRVEIMRAMWTEDEVNYEGSTTRSREICQPKPLQKPHIPIWVAGGGEKVTLNIAASLRPVHELRGRQPPVVRREKSKTLADHCTDVGTDYDAIVRIGELQHPLCGDRDRGSRAGSSELESRDRPSTCPRTAPAEFAKQFKYASGTPEQIVTYLKGWETLGLGYAIVYFPDPAYDLSGLELFARDVIPAFSRVRRLSRRGR